MSEKLKPLLLASYKGKTKSEIKPLLLSSYIEKAESQLKPQLISSYIEKGNNTSKPILFISYDGEIPPTPPPPLDYEVVLKPAGAAVAKKSVANIELKPASVVSKIDEEVITFKNVVLAVTFYTLPSKSFISKYKPELAVSFVAPDKRYYFRFDYQANLPFFPLELVKFAWKSEKNLSWETKSATSASGKKRMLSSQLSPKITIETKLNRMTDIDKEILFDFIRKVKGASLPFLWWDEDANTVENITLFRDGFGYYRLPFHPLETSYLEYAWYIDEMEVTVGGEKLPQDRFAFYKGAIIIFDKQGYEVKTILPEVKASFKYWWKVHFVDDKQGIERIFYNFNRSKSLKMEVVRRV